MKVLTVITYLIYIILWKGLIIGGCSYIVFGLGRSGWWFLLAVMLSAAAYNPSHWRKLWDDKVEIKENNE